MEEIMTLENKLNLTNEADLARKEEKISKIKAKELFETGYLDIYRTALPVAPSRGRGLKL